MAHPRGVKPHLERRGKPCFFEIKRAKFAAQRARKHAKFTMPEHVEFVGNWEVDDVERRVVELN